MPLQVTQVCDRCKRTRPIPNATPQAQQEGGWRVLDLGIAGDLPTLCPDCQHQVVHFILLGVDR